MSNEQILLLMINLLLISVEGYENGTNRLERIVYTDNVYVEEAQTWRVFLQKYNSLNPVVLLIDSATDQSHVDAKNFVRNIQQVLFRDRNIKFLLMKYNSTGVSGILATSHDDPEKFKQLLDMESDEPSSFLGENGHRNGSASFYSILNAIQLLPWNSAVIVFTGRSSQDEHLAQLTLKEVLQKRIQVFVVWSGALGSGKENILKELAVRSAGGFVISTEKDLSKYYYDQFLESTDAKSDIVSILNLRHISGFHNLQFPIDSEVTGLHLSITSDITSGILTTPSGNEIDLLNNEEVVRYAPGSFINRGRGIGSIQVHLNTSAVSSDVGVWHFAVNSQAPYYNVAVFAHTPLKTIAYLTRKSNGTGDDDMGSNRKIMRVGIDGDVTSITNVGFVNKNGETIVDNVKFELDPEWKNDLIEHVDNIETNRKREIDVDIENVPEGTFYTLINGKDSRGNDFRRLSYVGEYPTQNQFLLPPITVDVGLSSNLIVQPNSRPQILFEVTNYGNNPVWATFVCKDEKSILFSMQPWFQWISPRDTANVRVTLTPRPGSYQDLITFIVNSGTDTTTKNVLVDVGLNAQEDRSDPELDYEFTSNCLNVLLSSCEGGTWTVRVTARDSQSGLLLLDAKPKRLNFPDGYTTGTKEQVSGYYSDSCCNADLRLIAYDRANNRRTRDINAYRDYLGAGSIAAIVLGVLLLILVIALIGWAICRCCDGSRGTYNLPTYRAPTRSR